MAQTTGALSKLQLPISKYSRATGQSATSVPWSHLMAPDLSVAIWSSPSDSSRGELYLQVLQGTQLLEEVDIASQSDAALSLRQQIIEQKGHVPAPEQLPTFGIARDNLLALRYRGQNGECQRMQLRLQSVAACQQIVDLCVRRGLLFQEQRPRTGRPQTAASHPDFMVNRSHSIAPSPLLQTMQEPVRSSGFHMPVMEAGSFSRPSTSTGHLNPTLHGQIERQEVGARIPARHDQMVSGHSNVRHTGSPVLLAKDVMATRVSRSHTTMPSSMSPQVRAGSVDHGISGNLQDVPLASTLRSEPMAPFSDLRPPSNHSLASGLVKAPEHPELDLPPRRELPFKRPGSRRTGSDTGSSSRPGSATLALPPLRKPSLTKDRPTSMSGGEVLSARRDVPPLKVMGESSHLQRIPETMVHTSVQDANAVSTSRCAVTASDERHVSHHFPAAAATPAVSLPCRSAQTDASAQPTPPPTIRKHSEPATQAAPATVAQQAESTTVPPALLPSPPSSDPARDAAVARVVADLTRNTDLSAYAALDDATRMSILDSWMVGHLRKPGFVALCEDVENCWRRVALGL